MNNSVNREILRLSIPAIVSNITVPLLGLFDTGISGHLGSEKFLAAIAVGSVMLNVVFWLFGFLRMGTTGLTATALGANNGEEIRKVFTRALAIAVISGVLLIILQYPVFKGLNLLIGGGEEIKELIEEYFLIRIWGAPALLATMVLSGWFVGMQSTVYPLIINVGMNIVNIVVSFLLVYPANMGFEGIAWGTTISNYAGLGIGAFCCLYFIKGQPLFCRWRNLMDGSGLGKFFSVNSNLFIRSMCIIGVTMGVTAAGGQLGVMTLAVNIIVMQFFQFFSFFMDGFAFSGEAMLGLYAGANNRQRFNLSRRALLLWTGGMALVFTLIYLFGLDTITMMLTDSDTVRHGVSEIALFVILIPGVSAWAFIYDGFYIGITKTRIMMFATIIATIAFFVIAFINPGDGQLSIQTRGNGAIWTAFLVYLGLRGLLLAIYWKNETKNLFQASELSSLT